MSVRWVRSNRSRRGQQLQFQFSDSVRPENKHVAEVSLFSPQNPSRRFFHFFHSPICFRRRQIHRSFSLLPLLLYSIRCSIFLSLPFPFRQLLNRLTRLVSSSHRGCYCDKKEGWGCNAYRYRTRAWGASSWTRGLSLSLSIGSVKCILCFLTLFSGLFFVFFSLFILCMHTQNVMVKVKVLKKELLSEVLSPVDSLSWTKHLEGGSHCCFNCYLIVLIREGIFWK